MHIVCKYFGYYLLLYMSSLYVPTRFAVCFRILCLLRIWAAYIIQMGFFLLGLLINMKCTQCKVN
jgi:hypothetical protein